MEYLFLIMQSLWWPVELRILLVENGAGAHSSLADMLRLDGHIVSIAASVIQAIDLLRREVYDVLISELEFRDGTAPDILGGCPEHDGLVGIILTEIDSVSDLGAYSESGFLYHLKKPVDYECLKALLPGEEQLYLRQKLENESKRLLERGNARY
jgi:DNA-binding NtrC family response regulator